jgi:hypothetical protein
MTTMTKAEIKWAKKNAKYTVRLLECLEDLEVFDRVAILTCALQLTLKRLSISDRAMVKALSLELHETMVQSLDDDERVVPFVRRKGPL